MTQIKLKASMGSQPKSPKTVDCEWTSCEGKHPTKPKYPKGGKVTKGGYADRWDGAGMLPWDLYGGFRTVYSKIGKVINKKTYRVQRHHLVPSTVLKATGTLKHNAELIGYDVDDEKNGLILPWYAIDQPLNRLPQHLGNHPAGYYDPIREVVNEIEEFFDGICNEDMTGELGPQAGLIGELLALAEKARQMVLAIRAPGPFWPLRSNARPSFIGAEAEYRKREALNKALSAGS